jgi:hypothetical protein
VLVDRHRTATQFHEGAMLKRSLKEAALQRKRGAPGRRTVLSGRGLSRRHSGSSGHPRDEKDCRPLRAHTEERGGRPPFEDAVCLSSWPLRITGASRYLRPACRVQVAGEGQGGRPSPCRHSASLSVTTALTKEPSTRFHPFRNSHGSQGFIMGTRVA